MTYKTTLNENTANFFNNLEVKRESWIPAEKQIEAVAIALTDLNADRNNLNSSDLSNYLGFANSFIKNGYNFLDTNKEELQEPIFNMLKNNTEINLANTLILLDTIESYEYISNLNFSKQSPSKKSLKN